MYDWAQFAKQITNDMDVFYSDSKTDIKLQCDCCIKTQPIHRCPRCC